MNSRVSLVNLARTSWCILLHHWICIYIYVLFRIYEVHSDGISQTFAFLWLKLRCDSINRFVYYESNKVSTWIVEHEDFAWDWYMFNMFFTGWKKRKNLPKNPLAGSPTKSDLPPLEAMVIRGVSSWKSQDPILTQPKMVLVFHWEKKWVSFFFGVQSFQDDLAIKVSFPNTKSVYKCFFGGE